jgi:uncharacterized lipoprotein YmbA
MMRHAAAVLTLCGLVTVAAGCGSSPPSRFYTLSGTTTAAAAPSNLSIAVGPVTIPGAVDRPQMVVSTGANQVELDEFNRWAAPLGNNISRVVAMNLVTLLGTPNVSLFPQMLSANTDFRVAIEVQRFDSTPGDSALLDAVWTVRRTTDGKSDTGRTTAREPVSEKSYDALVAAHSRAVARLSQDIATSVRGLGGGAR